jgi:biopolymer transport protein ExbD
MLQIRPRPNRLIRRIDSLALAAIFVVLTTSMMFLQSMTFKSHHGVSAELPYAHNSRVLWGTEREDALFVLILRDGELFFGSSRVTPAQLTTQLRVQVGRGSPTNVYIRADGRARYSAVSSVLNSIHSAGITNVVFLTAPTP